MPQENEKIASNTLGVADRLEVFASVYKLPLIFGVIGVVLLVAAVGLVVRTVQTSSDVVFTTSSTSSAQTKIHIDIQGAVMKPGVYEFTGDSRVGDALTISGGLGAGADRQWIAKNLNRAAKLIDGGKIYIPTLIETSEGKTQNSNVKTQNQNDISSIGNSNNLLGVTTKTININSATLPELDTIPGVGSVTANKIIAGRPYQTVEELKNRKIIGQSLYNKIKDLLTI